MRREVKIGLTLLGAFVFLYLGITWVKNMHLFSGGQKRYQILFDNVAGLREGDPVTIFGYRAGTVSNITPQSGGVEVEVNLKKTVELFQDAIAEIRVKELLGGKLVEIQPGGIGSALAANSRLPQKGRTSLDFATAFSKMGSFMDGFDQEKVTGMIDNLNKVADAFARVSGSLDSVSPGDMFLDLEKSIGNINGMLVDVRQRNLIGKLDNSLGKINELAGQADQALEDIGDLTGDFKAKTLPAADSLLDEISGFLAETKDMMTEVRGVLDQSKDKSTAIGMLLYDPAFARNLDSALTNLNLTMEHVRHKKLFVSMQLGKKQKYYDDKVEKK